MVRVVVSLCLPIHLGDQNKISGRPETEIHRNNTSRQARVFNKSVRGFWILGCNNFKKNLRKLFFLNGRCVFTFNFGYVFVIV